MIHSITVTFMKSAPGLSLLPMEPGTPTDWTPGAALRDDCLAPQAGVSPLYSLWGKRQVEPPSAPVLYLGATYGNTRGSLWAICCTFASGICALNAALISLMNSFAIMEYPVFVG
jgi:hypothetical protein